MDKKEICANCIGKKLTGVYFNRLSGDGFHKAYKEINHSVVFSDLFYFEFEDTLVRLNNDYTLQISPELLSEEKKPDLFCANELFNEQIGKRVEEVVYSFEMSEYIDAFTPSYSLEINLESNAGIRVLSLCLGDKDICERNILKLRTHIDSKYRCKYLDVCLKNGWTNDDINKFSERLKGMNETEREVFLHRYLTEHGYINENE